MECKRSNNLFGAAILFEILTMCSRAEKGLHHSTGGVQSYCVGNLSVLKCDAQSDGDGVVVELFLEFGSVIIILEFLQSLQFLYLIAYTKQ